MYEPQKFRAASFEVLVVVFTRRLCFCFAGLHRVVGEADFLVETVHVQLAHKRGIVVMFEELRNERSCKFVLVEHNEGIAIIRPSNEVGVVFLVKKTVECQRLTWRVSQQHTCLAFVQTAESVFVLLEHLF